VASAGRTSYARARVSGGTVLLAYDGTPAAAEAMRHAAEVLGRRPAVVVTVWEEGLATTPVLPSVEFGMAPGPVDIETAMEVDEAVHAHATRVAGEGAALATKLGFEPAQAVAVADEVNVAETLVHVAEQRGAEVIVLATGHAAAGRLRSRLLGSTVHSVLRHAHVPVLIVPAARPEPAPDSGP
jgi:nucleotide-binding universal stress UspA family protein